MEGQAEPEHSAAHSARLRVIFATPQLHDDSKGPTGHANKFPATRERMFTTPANAPHHLTFLRFAARVPLGTQSCVSRLRVPSVRGGQ